MTNINSLMKVVADLVAILVGKSPIDEGGVPVPVQVQVHHLLLGGNWKKSHLQITVVESSLCTHHHHGHRNLNMILGRMSSSFALM